MHPVSCRRWLIALGLLSLMGCNPDRRPALNCVYDSECPDGYNCEAGTCQMTEPPDGCARDDDCQAWQMCIAGDCLAAVYCQNDGDCPQQAPTCDPVSHRCVVCLPDCLGKCCGQNGCGGICQDACAATGQTCNPDACLCEGTCTANCAGRECGPDGCGTSCQPGCEDGEFCDDTGHCQLAGCRSKDECAEPTPWCEAKSGVCVQCLESNHCPEGLTCQDGVCGLDPLCLKDDQCELSQICVEGLCVTGCRGSRDCPDEGGWTCRQDIGEYGTCVQCAEPSDCPDGTTCRNYRCVVFCTTDAHCLPRYCQVETGECVECVQDDHCQTGSICEEFVCLPGCREEGDCPIGHCDLENHVCVDCLGVDHCPLGNLCIDRVCLSGCLGDRDCPEGLHCDTELGEHGGCVECLEGGDHCADGYHCVDGLCEFFCGSDDDCQPPRPACLIDQGTCVECTGNVHCDKGTICVDQACVPGCQSQADCPEDSQCDVELGQYGGCVECLDENDCPQGYACDNQQCVLSGNQMIRLPAGTFVRGSDPGEGDEDERPEAIVALPTVYIDQTPVTNAQYRACVEAGACNAPQAVADRDAYGDPEQADFPVVNVSWGMARDFCWWVGKELPSEARWERAARGTADERTYPWGDQAPTCDRTNMFGCQGRIEAVALHPDGASPDGVLDMAGNVWEWVYDWYQADYYATSKDLDDPFGPGSDDQEVTNRVVRGGSYDSLPTQLRVANRAARAPDVGYPDVGFRCALVGVPQAVFTVEPTRGPFAETLFSVDASLSTDPNHPLDALEVRWDWDGDNAFDTNWTTAKRASHRFVANGVYRIWLEVRDPDNNTDKAWNKVMAEGHTGWDGAPCASEQDCAHGFVCVPDYTNVMPEYFCREDCWWLLDENCFLADRTCQSYIDFLGATGGYACLPP